MPLELDKADGDWIKRGHLDLPVDNVDDLRVWLEQNHITVEQFKKLDVYQANKDRTWLANL